MNLEPGKTIFDKIKMPYDTLRLKQNPIKPIIDYYKSKLNPGDELWWMDVEDNSKPSDIIIKVWNNISIKERNQLKNCAMVYFPELFGNSGDKYGRLAIWLITREAIVCPNVRDLFTAGGKKDYFMGEKIYKNVPRVLFNLFNSIDVVFSIIMHTSAYELSEYWGIKTTENRKISDWINLVYKHSRTLPSSKQLDVKKILDQLISL